MATATSNRVHDNSSVANFKSWAQAISAAFAAFGWIQAADSGQVNWSSLASVPSNAYVYEIWKANDAQAATLPIFVRVEYGYSATVVRIRVTVGTGSDGSGTINGGVVTSAPWQLTQLETNNGAITYPCYFSGDAGEFRMFLWQNTSSATAVIFGIERAKDSSGAKTADYFTALSACAQNYNGHKFQSVLSASLVAPANTGVGCWLTAQASLTTAAFNSIVAAFPVFPFIGQLGNPMLGYAAAVSADVADGATATISSMYGGTHTYLVGKQGSLGGTQSPFTATFAVLMRYE